MREYGQERRFTVAVAADDPDALPFVDRDGLVFEHELSRPLVADVLAAYQDSHLALAPVRRRDGRHQHGLLEAAGLL